MGHQGGYLNISARNWIFWAAIFVALFFSGQTVRGQGVSPSIEVTVNKSLVFRLAQKAKKVSVSQPEIADVLVVAPNQLLINGKGVGTTSLVIFDQKGVVTNYDLSVTPDVSALRRQLRTLFPEEKIQVSTSGPAIVLRGEVSNEVVYDKVLEVTQTYLPPKPPGEVAPSAASQSVTIKTGEARLPTTGTAFAGGGQLAFPEEGSLMEVNRWGNKRAIPGIIDFLVIKEVRQIQLNVIVAEISLTKLREVGFDFVFQLLHGKNTSNFFSGAGSQGGLTGTDLLDPTNFPPTLTTGSATSGAISLLTNRYDIGLVYRLFQNRDITEILAKPNLVIKNGRSGGFLSGGEFPLPIRTNIGAGDTSSQIEFKPFGVRLDFLPTITWSDSIDLRIFPEVSEIDESRTVLGIPGLTVRRSVSRVEMKEGETLILSGLMDRRILRDVSKFPLLGDIPILGALFRTTRFRNQETELIFVITPKIVKPLRPGEKPKIPSVEKYDDPDMRQVPLSAPRKPVSPRGRAAAGATIP